MTAAGSGPATREQWRRLVAAVLDRAGTAYPAAEPEAALVGPTDEGLAVRALYTAADLSADLPPPPPPPPTDLLALAPDPAGAGLGAGPDSGWDVRQQHRGPDPVEVNRAVLDDLQGGVTSVWLVLERAEGDGPVDATGLARVLAGVRLDLAPIALDAGADTSAAGAAFLDLIAEGKVPAAAVRGTLGADPLGLGLRTGTTPDLAVAVEALQRCRDFPALQAITVDGTVYHDAGAGESDELAVTAAVGVAYVRAGLDAGLGLPEVLRSIGFRFAVSDDQFLSMAKLRAARRIWARVAQLSGAPERDRGQHQHAVTSAAMMTRRDPWVNLLRTTVAGFAAVVGGADAVTVAPFDSAVGAPDAFARRLARNTHAVLHDEASAARVADPGAGSWYLEALTAQLAEAAWDRFTALERVGGAANAGAVADLLARTRDRRDRDVATGRRPITGVSTFPALDETVLTRPPAHRSRPGRTGRPGAEPTRGLPARRYAEPYETQRDRSDAILARTGQRPVVFLAVPTGSDHPRPDRAQPRAHAGRAARAADLFATGGIATTTARGDPGELAAAFVAGGGLVACVCAPDGDLDTVAALVAVGAELVDVEPIGADGPAEAGAGIDGPALLRRTLDLIEAR